MAVFETPLRVRYAETDQMGVVYHAHLLVYFEVARVELLRAVGLSYADLERGGLRLAVVEASLDYRRPIRYDAALVVRTRVVEVGRASVTFAYEVTGGGGEPCARGSTRLASLGADGLVRALPKGLRNLLLAHLEPG